MGWIELLASLYAPIHTLNGVDICASSFIFLARQVDITCSSVFFGHLDAFGHLHLCLQMSGMKQLAGHGMQQYAVC